MKSRLSQNGLKDLISGVSHDTSLGKRYLDIIDATTHQAWECKVGNLRWSARIQKRIAKDAELLSNGEVAIKRITWVVGKNPVTGVVKVDERIVTELRRHGIGLEVIP